MREADAATQEVSQDSRPRSVEIVRGGINTAGDFAKLMSALMSDVLEGKVDHRTCNAAVNAGGKLLKVVEMQFRYGRPVGDGPERELSLCQNPTRNQIASDLNQLEEQIKLLKERNGVMATK